MYCRVSACVMDLYKQTRACSACNARMARPARTSAKACAADRGRCLVLPVATHFARLFQSKRSRPACTYVGEAACVGSNTGMLHVLPCVFGEPTRLEEIDASRTHMYRLVTHAYVQAHSWACPQPGQTRSSAAK